MNTVTIRARLVEDVTEDGIGYPKSVHVTGGQFLSRDAAIEIAQEAVDSNYTQSPSGYTYLAVIDPEQWNLYRKQGTDNGLTAQVVEYR